MTHIQLPDGELPTELQDALERHNLRDAQYLLGQRPPHVIADELARMNAVDAVVAFRLLDKDEAIKVFEELEPVDQQAILMGLRDVAFRELVEELDPDDRVRMLREAPAKVVQKVLAGLSAHERQVTAALLGYPEGSVGRYMTPEVVALDQHLTVQQALEFVRSNGGDAETVYTLPVVDTGRRLTGVVELRELVLSPPGIDVVDLVVADVPPRARRRLRGGRGAADA
ncbi:magnesium transporter MgtE N-terminal domain-containing protein [Streptomyces sp. NPDC093591]|uniref:magnesium transporter MgtE N-terminal domain-containing protein n=1 Tax=Streptomyces sp. NPDC093591 TaxID=3366044 RepID=UPI00382F4911